MLFPLLCSLIHLVIQWFIFLFSKYLLSTYHVPSTELTAKDKQDRQSLHPCLVEICFIYSLIHSTNVTKHIIWKKLGWVLWRMFRQMMCKPCPLAVFNLAGMSETQIEMIHSSTRQKKWPSKKWDCFWLRLTEKEGLKQSHKLRQILTFRYENSIFICWNHKGKSKYAHLNIWESVTSWVLYMVCLKTEEKNIWPVEGYLAKNLVYVASLYVHLPFLFIYSIIYAKYLLST